jgi:DNA mismatch endonuclease (patch repair protein)
MTRARLKLPTDPVRSALMKRVRQSKTSAEDAVAAALRHCGLRYRRNVRGLPGSPDFANKTQRWAIFVNGCFWHHHRCVRGTTPMRNRKYWTEKFDQNRRRDAAKMRALRGAGFRVLLLWECEAENPDLAIRRIEKLRVHRFRKRVA